MPDTPAALTDAELEALSSCKSEVEWNQHCDEVKAARNGAYPPDWYQKVLASGLFAKAQVNWLAP